MRQRLTLMIIAGVALTAAAWTYAGTPPTPQEWEYLFQTQCNQVQANSLGAVGWELVTMDPSSAHRQCIYKRPKS